MKARILLLVGVGLISLLMFVSSTGFVQSKQTVWEYKVLEANWDEKQLNNLGAEGWELVAVDAARGDYIRAFFKRRK
jgi:hypothetical protein